MSTIVGAVSAWVPMLKRLENAAPPELAPDLEHIRVTFQEQQKLAANYGGSAVTFSIGMALYGLMTSDSWHNFATFVQNNCSSSAMTSWPATSLLRNSPI
jgi:hypothetical protein